MAAACSVNNGGRDYLTVLNFINLELLSVTKVLEDLTVFISYCYFHDFLLIIARGRNALRIFWRMGSGSVPHRGTHLLPLCAVLLR